MGYYDPPDPLIFRCPVSLVSNEDCNSLNACDDFQAHDDDEDCTCCVNCGEDEQDHHDCYDKADSAGVFDPPERDY